MGALEMCDFIEECRDRHLTLRDFRTLGPGQTLDVVQWDSNFMFRVWDFADAGVRYDPETFFARNRSRITYLGGIEWEIAFWHGETYTHPIHVDASKLATYWRWVSVEPADGKIHITSEIVDEGAEIPAEWEPKHIHWTELPESTRVGWRGPLMLWTHLKGMPQVYWEDLAGSAASGGRTERSSGPIGNKK